MLNFSKDVSRKYEIYNDGDSKYSVILKLNAIQLGILLFSKYFYFYTLEKKPVCFFEMFAYLLNYVTLSHSYFFFRYVVSLTLSQLLMCSKKWIAGYAMESTLALLKIVD
jgi:hypothetical protein